MNSNEGAPTLWIALTTVFALAAIGLGIWAFALRSDRDDAQATVDRQQAQLRGEEQSASGKEAELSQELEDARAAYRRVRRSLISAERQEADFKAEVDREAAELRNARSQVSSAQSTEERERARLRVSRQARQLATTCIQGAVDTIDGFLRATANASGTNVAPGAKAAMTKLEQLEPGCKQALNPS